jgi:cytochrome P450
VLYLVRHPAAQAAAREEVERVTGEEQPGLGHQLPYCQAVIQEVQRLACVAPQTIPHRSAIPSHPSL